MRMHFGFAVLVCLLLAAAPVARADDEIFAGLMPGKVVPEEELGLYFGAAVVQFTASDGSVVTNSGTIDTSQLNSLGNYSATGGISTPIQFQGDHNSVNVTIHLEVNMNTVNVTESGGASVTVNQTLDFGGGVVGGFVQ
jgi:hypothetical protein